MCFALVGGVDNDQSIVDCASASRKVANMGQELVGREPQGLKYITANLFPCTYLYATCMLPEYYMCLLAPNEYKHPSITSSHSGCEFQK